MKKNKGQYFTPEPIAEFMTNLIENPSPKTVLEPCAGKGIFLMTLQKLNSKIVAIEIDSKLQNESGTQIQYMDFFDYPIENKFDVVIGNPPYIRWKNQTIEKRKELLERSFWGKQMNGLSDMLQPFIFKSVEHLNDNGELIFITPKFWLQTLHSINLREFLRENGYIDIVIDFNEKTVFDDASLNVIIFKFVKTPKQSPTKYIRFINKKKIDKEDLDSVMSHLKEMESMEIDEYYRDDRFEAYLSDLPDHDSKWYFIPHNRNEIQRLEDSCLYSPDFTLEDNQKVKLTRLFTKEDLKNIKIEGLKPSQVKLFDKTYFKISHSDDSNNLDRYARLNQKKNKQPKHPETEERYIRIEDIAEIGNGMVSGLDKAFNIKSVKDFNELEKIFIINVVKSKDFDRITYKKIEKYIFIPETHFSSEKEFAEQCPHLHEHLTPFKQELEKRWIPHPINWWEWAFPRNKTLIESCDRKILVPCKERFDKRQYVRFVLAIGKDIYANQDVTVIVKKDWVKESEEYITAFLSSSLVYVWLIYKGLIRGGVLEFSEKPLSEIPFRLINWSDPAEVKVHDEITSTIQQIKHNELSGEKGIKKINSLFEKIIR